MAECELCGRFASKRAKIEEAVVNVCENCSHLGIVIEEKNEKITFFKKEYEIKEIILNPNFPVIVKGSREEKNLTKKQLAEKLGEKEFVIERIEKGMLPDEKIRKKLEKFFNIRLDYKEINIDTKKLKNTEITIGDIAEVRVKGPQKSFKSHS